MGDGEWMVRLSSFASSGAWPSGAGNRPAPWQLQIEKCPLQAHGQTTLFGGSMVCSCGFHTTTPETATSTQAAAAPPQTPAPRSFLRPPPSLSMWVPVGFTKAQFSRTEDPQPSPSSVKTVSPSPSSVRTPTMPSVMTPSPSPSSMSTKPKGPVRTPSPSPSSLQTHIPASFSEEEPGRVQPTPAEASASFWLPGELVKTIPMQDQRWIANTLFHSGKLRPDLKLWYEPPVPALIYHQRLTGSLPIG
ncbi:proline-rich receptor kinase PERK2 [Labeo rohita]|uniref:Proline-rich receptor kinase PERK2 n=1 Tax=Labeo rohita TaxID=84645 RepID=A0A498MNY3_LABRO|nr:proline-rich receptor kinase PERK2 [Labeo rohita]